MRHDESIPLDDDLRYGPELSRTLDTALNDLPLRTEFLVAGAVARGTRTRRRRRVALWGSLGTVTAAALTAAALLLTLPGQRGQDTVQTVALPDFSSAGGDSAPAGKERLTGAATLALLAELLPGAPSVADSEARDSDPRFTAVQTYGEVGLRDGGEVAVWLQGSFVQQAEKSDGAGSGFDRPTSKPESSDPTHMPSRSELGRHYSCRAGDDGCRIAKLGDGSVLLFRERGSGSTAELTADVLRPDGTRVVVKATGTAYRAAQVQALATSPRWQEWVDPEVNRAAERAGH
ncbi:hypothetical protein [Streptomyces sp. NPDC088789]|uniref:hypothetical protein n=1 Tax=Streptomyces sp. NPDC088789 TaxID=3365899 RepID=UPI0037F342A0